MIIPKYPDFIPIGLELKDDLYPRLNMTPDGVSEFTFSNLYLFRKRYNYRLSHDDNTLIISGDGMEKGFL